ncbi:MAG: FKBP-type peptidyl-prolyl cis-trans isomerase [Bacteroidales bacterium]|nr:FKBP-type peptidyl-prolyl cis-trans isomerase [Bacteroidales bacterium]
MKKLSFVALTITLALSSCNQKSSSVKLKNDIDSLSYCIGVSIGENLKEADLPSFNVEVFRKAVEDVLAKRETKIKPENAGMYIQEYFTKLQMEQGMKNLKEGQEFLKKNKEKKGVVTTASGLQYEVLKEGTGPHPTKDDMVSIHYKGSLIDGTVFDSSYDRGQPATFAVGGVIPGFTEALQLMTVGSKYRVWIPAELGYGAAGNPRGKIKPNSVLVFEIELLSIDSSASAKK